jgi:mannose-6-phosphate isomerase
MGTEQVVVIKMSYAMPASGCPFRENDWCWLATLRRWAPPKFGTSFIMSATRLASHKINKPWGRRDIPEVFGVVYEDEEPVGEILFEYPGGGDSELLVKFIFTAERLSIQTHPNDTDARADGRRRGKDEAWLILTAEPGAQIGVGTRRPANADELRQAAQDGSIVDLLAWRSVRPGEFIFLPAGTLHAIGAGLSLIEIQQNCDVTYRLYDYGRPRELHVEAAIAATHALPWQQTRPAYEVSPGRVVEASGHAFVVERWRNVGDVAVRPNPRQPLWIVPVSPGGVLERESLDPGSVYLLERDGLLSLPQGAEALIAYPGGVVADALFGQVLA